MIKAETQPVSYAVPKVLPSPSVSAARLRRIQAGSAFAGLPEAEHGGDTRFK